LRDKFRRHKELRAKLLATNPKDLVYENDHNDTVSLSFVKTLD
jgi:predicted NAD-dependent protein-ADP-ribosyltransferase YbiA (DUF1768 family)